MATDDFVVSDVVPADPATVYTAWLSSEGHSEMTGASASVEARVGGQFHAWDGYISGVNEVLDAPRRVVQTWRTSDFASDDPDSTIEVSFDEVPEGTLVTVRHGGVPAEQRGYEEGGWAQSYFAPMKEYFQRRARLGPESSGDEGERQ